MGEAKAVDQAEGEDHQEAELTVGRAEDVFQGDDHDRRRDDRFDNVSRGRDVAQGGQREGDRVGGRESRDLDQDRLPGAAEQEETEDEQDVVEAFGQDVFEALLEVAEEGGAGAAVGVMGADAAGGGAGRGLGGEPGQIEREARLTGEHHHEAGVFLAVDGVGEDRGDLVAGQGAHFPAGHAGGDLRLPATAGDDGVVHLHEGLTRLGDEVVGEVRLDAADRLEGELQVGRHPGPGLLKELFALGVRIGQELLLFQGEGHLRAVRPVTGVDFDGDLGFTAGLEGAADRDVGDRVGAQDGGK